MKGRPERLFLYVFIFISCCCRAQDRLVQELDLVTEPFGLAENTGDLYFLDPVLKDKKIVALGESNHATSEFFTIKAKVMRHCIMNLGYKAVAIEADLTGTRSMNRYIATGEGDARSALRDMGIAAWMTEEMLRFAEWLRIYNFTRQDPDKVRFFGFDMAFCSNTVALLKRNHLSSAQLLTGPFTFLDSLAGFNGKNPAQVKQWQKLEAALEQQLLVASDIGNADELQELLTALRQYIGFKMQKDPEDQMAVRDSCMAQNIRYLENKHGLKMLVWAHNEHVSKGENAWKKPYMGGYLNTYYKEDYYAIGLFTGNGKLGYYNAMKKEIEQVEIAPDKKSTDRIFRECSKPLFFLDMNKALKQSSAMADFVSKDRWVRVVSLEADQKKKEFEAVNYYQKTSLLRKFDGIIFIRESHGANPLGKVR